MEPYEKPRPKMPAYLKGWVMGLVVAIAGAIGWGPTMKAIETARQYVDAHPLPTAPEDLVSPAPPVVMPEAEPEFVDEVDPSLIVVVGKHAASVRQALKMVPTVRMSDPRLDGRASARVEGWPNDLPTGEEGVEGCDGGWILIWRDRGQWYAAWFDHHRKGAVWVHDIKNINGDYCPIPPAGEPKGLMGIANKGRLRSNIALCK